MDCTRFRWHGRRWTVGPSASHRASRRLGQPKQLLMLGGETTIERAIRLVHEGGVSTPVIVVLGAHSELIRETVVMVDSTSVINNIWEQGIATSIQAGLAALEPNPPETSGALILGCDQPRLTAKHVCALLKAFHAQAESVIVASAYARRPGHPSGVFPLGLRLSTCASRRRGSA